MRIDKWLKMARIFKSREEAGRACDLGRVKLNGLEAKPSKVVKAGDEIVVRVARSAGFIVCDSADELEDPGIVSVELDLPHSSSRTQGSCVYAEGREYEGMNLTAKVLYGNDHVVAFVNYQYRRFEPVTLRSQYIFSLNLDQVLGFSNDDIELLRLHYGCRTGKDKA